MFRQLVFLAIAVLGPSTSGVAVCEASSNDRAPNISSQSKMVLLAGEDQVNLSDLSWISWRFSPQPRVRDDWKEILKWVEERKVTLTQEMRQKLSAMDPQIDTSRLPNGCFEDRLCSQMAEVAERLSLFRSAAQLSRAQHEAVPIFLAFLDMNEISSTIANRRLKDATQVQDVLELRGSQDQALQAAKQRLGKRVSPDGKIVLFMLMNCVSGRVTYDNAEYLKQEAHEHGWPKLSVVGHRNAQLAWVMIQHADYSSALQFEVLEMMKPLVDAGEVLKSSYAYLYDRFRVNIGQPQRYGTQFHCANGYLERQPLESPGDVNMLRASMELGPIENYQIGDGSGKCEDPTAPS